MGIEAVALGVGVGSSLLGSVLGYGEQRAARRRASDIVNQGQGELDSMISGKLNSGQDSYLQYLRSNPGALDPFKFDTSQEFKALAAQDQQTIGDQAAQLRSSVGSLGERFGSGFASREALLRSRFATDVGVRNAQISQGSFNTALGLGLQDFQASRANQSQLLGILAGTRQQNIQNQLSALGIGGNAGSQAASGGLDISQLLLLSHFLGGSGGGGGGVTSATVPTPGSFVSPQSYTWNPAPYRPDLRP